MTIMEALGTLARSMPQLGLLFLAVSVLRFRAAAQTVR